MSGEAATGPGTADLDVHELAARVNLRMAQLAWRVVANVERDPNGPERLVLRPTREDGSVDPAARPFSIGPTSLGRPNALEAILSELRARGWNRLGERASARADVLWCAPA